MIPHKNPPKILKYFSKNILKNLFRSSYKGSSNNSANNLRRYSSKDFSRVDFWIFLRIFSKILLGTRLKMYSWIHARIYVILFSDILKKNPSTNSYKHVFELSFEECCSIHSKISSKFFEEFLHKKLKKSV